MLGRRRLLLLVGGAAVYPACGGREVSPASSGGATDGAGGNDGLETSVADATTESSSGDDGSVTADAPSGPDTSGGNDGQGVDGTVDGGPVGDGTTADTGGVDAGADGSSDGAGSDDAIAGNDGAGCPTGSNVLPLPFSQYPQLLQTGGSVQVTASNYSDPVCGQNNIIVVNTAPGQFVALSSSCTHACCVVSLTGSVLHCPCHGVGFNLQGQVVMGTDTTTPLQVLPTCSDSSGVYVTLV